jgi:hypothetical protein
MQGTAKTTHLRLLMPLEVVAIKRAESSIFNKRFRGCHDFTIVQQTAV